MNEAASVQDYIRQLRARKLNQPDPDRAWQVGGALSRLSGKRWLNPAVVVYVFGHYDRFADMVVRVAANETIERLTLVEMVRLLPKLASYRERQLSLVGRKVKDQLAVAEAKAWEKALAPTEPIEVRVWSIDGEMYAAFAEAWRAHGIHPPPAGAEGVIGACALIADRALYSVEERDRQVSAVLSEWLAR